MNKHLMDLREQLFKIEVEVLEGGKLPLKAHASDAGFDLYATEDFCVEPGEVIRHPLKIKLKLPDGSWARVEGKSGLGAKGLLVFAGVIDTGYRGEISAVVTNLNHKSGVPIKIEAGDKVAQLTMNPYNKDYYMVQVANVPNDTDRGSGGFGSTGQK